LQIDTAKISELMQDRQLTQGELARRAGISRQSVSAILGKAFASVRPATADKLCAALGLKTGALEVGGPRKAYLARVAREHERLDFTGLGVVSRDQTMPMDAGFAALAIQEESEADDPGMSRRTNEGTASCPDATDREPFTLGGSLHRHRRLFLLGDPGAGKTTSLRHIARAYALGRMRDHAYPVRGRDTPVPVFIRLASWADRLAGGIETDLADEALAQLSLLDDPDMADWLRKHIENRDAFLLLDGLDEVADPEAVCLVMERIRSFVDSHAKARVIVSSRIVGFDRPTLGRPFGVARIVPLGNEAVAEFAATWYAYKHNHQPSRQCRACAGRVEDLLHAVGDHQHVRALAGNPMMLTILALLHEAGAALPQRRFDLYDKVCEALLFSWEEKKRAALRSAPDEGLTLEGREVLWLLESLALAMQRDDRTLVQRWWLERHIYDYLTGELGLTSEKARPEADTLVWSLRQRSGLLVERGPGRYGFAHLAFQEHFAARAILEEPDPVDAIRPYFYHPRWREVMMLVAAQIGRRKVVGLFRAILDDPDPTGRFLQRGFLAALACLADGAPVHDGSLLEDLARAAAELGRSRWLGIALTAMHFLSRLRGTRLGDFAGRCVDGMLDKAKESLQESERDSLLCRAVDHGFRKASRPKRNKRNGDAATPPIGVERVEIEGRTFGRLAVRVPEKLTAAWAKRVTGLLANDASPGVRSVCARELGRFVERSRTARRALLGALKEEKDTDVREGIAHSLRPVAGDAKVQAALRRVMKADADDEVRGACAAALEGAAAEDETLRAELVGILRSDEPPALRSGAASGLSAAAAVDGDVAGLLRGVALDEDKDDSVRTSCLHALEDLLPSLRDGADVLRAALRAGPDSPLAAAAAMHTLEYAATGRMSWDELPIAEAEAGLVERKKPCPHIWGSLCSLVDAREVRRLGVPLETRIQRALRESQESIAVAFVFGSAARHEQGPESDVDLMVVGDVSLEELAPALRRLEQELGRQVNAVVYSEDEWRRRLGEGNPFANEVAAGAKRFVVGGADELTGLV
jgi:predicted nucleotidyltransferase/DNA-binding Xre family transcriptional regulator